MSWTFHGIGTGVYGERDYWPDGSFVTTEWFFIAWIPLIPICSKRISYTHNSDYAVFDPDGYYVYETMGVNRRQVIYTYLWIASVVAPIALWGTFQEALTTRFGDEDRPAEFALILTAGALMFPYLLRRLAKIRKRREWARQSLGLHG
jgi:hypothetical protein